MNSLLKAVFVAALSLLVVNGSVLAKKCCSPKMAACCKKETRPCCQATVNIPVEPVTLTRTCDDAGSFKLICRKEYLPCQGQVNQFKACPKFEGIFFDEQGAEMRIDNTTTQPKMKTQKQPIMRRGAARLR